MDDDACVLIVEADVLVRSELADYLRVCGYRVLEAGDGQEEEPLLSSGEEGCAVARRNSTTESSGAGVRAPDRISGSSPIRSACRISIIAFSSPRLGISVAPNAPYSSGVVRSQC